MEKALKNTYSVTVGKSLRVTIEHDGVVPITKSDEIISALTAFANRVDSVLNDAGTSYEHINGQQVTQDAGQAAQPDGYVKVVPDGGGASAETVQPQDISRIPQDAAASTQDLGASAAQSTEAPSTVVSSETPTQAMESAGVLKPQKYRDKVSFTGPEAASLADQIGASN